MKSGYTSATVSVNLNLQQIIIRSRPSFLRLPVCIRHMLRTTRMNGSDEPFDDQRTTFYCPVKMKGDEAT